MYWRTEIVVKENSLKERHWRFHLFNEANVQLESVIDWERPTRRHKHRAIKVWDRFDKRNNTMEKPEIPSHIKEEVIQRIIHDITFE